MRFLHASFSILSLAIGLGASACTTTGSDESVHLEDVVSAGGQLVAVGFARGVPHDAASGAGPAYDTAREAVIVTSADGSAWTELAVGVNVPLWGVAHGAGRFVAVGGDRHPIGDGSEEEIQSVVLTSTDGRAWTQIASPPGEPLRRIAFGGGRFVALSGDGNVFTSSDGESWSAGPKGVVSGQCGIVFGAGRFVGCGVESSVVSSTDGVTWAGIEPSVSSPVVSITFANGDFIAGLSDVCDETPCYGSDSLIRSKDGQSWDGAAVPIDAYPTAAAFFDGTYAATTASGLARSSDGASWSAVALPEGSVLQGITAGPKGFVAVGSGEILTSADGLKWSMAHVF